MLPPRRLPPSAWGGAYRIHKINQIVGFDSF
jgi:hypothetical protein